MNTRDMEALATRVARAATCRDRDLFDDALAAALNALTRHQPDNPEAYARAAAKNAVRAGFSRSRRHSHEVSIEGAALIVAVGDHEDVVLAAIDGDEAHRAAHVRELLAVLTPRMRQAVELVFGLDGEPHNLVEAGAVMNVSKQRVRALLDDALDRMRRAARADLTTTAA